MLYPIWPLFVTSYLGANMAILGLIDGLGEAVVSISKAFSGYVSDKIKKRKVFIYTGYILGSISRIGYALSTSWHYLIPFRILDRAGKIRSAPRDAFVADISTKDIRGKNFGLLRAMDNLGAVTGILICVSLFKFLGYTWLLLLAAIPSGIAALLIFIFIREKPGSIKKIYKGLTFKQLSRNFKLFLFLSALFALGSFSYSFLLVFAKNFGFKTTFIPLLYLTFTAIASFFSLPFGILSDKTSRKFVLILSFVFWALTCLTIIFSNSYLGVILAFVWYGLHKGALEPVQQAFVAELAPANYRASSIGGFQMVIGLCAFPASLIAGILWTRINAVAPFFFSLGLTALSIFLLFLVKEKNNLLLTINKK